MRVYIGIVMARLSVKCFAGWNSAGGGNGSKIELYIPSEEKKRRKREIDIC